MDKNFANELSRLTADDSLKSVVRHYEASLAKVRCTEETFGKWIEEFGLSFLTEIFSLNDEDFKEDFPEMNLTAEERNYLREGIASHVALCPHCRLKVERDEELNAAFDRKLGLGAHHNSVAR